MSLIELDPAFPNQVLNPLNLVLILPSGEPVAIEEGAVWGFHDGRESTPPTFAMWLEDCEDKRLQGAGYETDFSGGYFDLAKVHAATLEDLIGNVLTDLDLLAQHIADHLARARAPA